MIRRKIKLKRNNKIKIDLSKYNSINKCQAFMTMWKIAVSKNNEKYFDEILIDWWFKTFDKNPPISKRRDLLYILEYELLYRGMIENNLKISDTFLQNYKASKFLLTKRNFAISRFNNTSKELFNIEKYFIDFLNDDIKVKTKFDKIILKRKIKRK